jgi:putative glutamine amidotransferase
LWRRAGYPTTSGISDLRDEFELALLTAALDADLPVLAICRGVQLLNVGLGGTLYQDVADCFPKPLNHKQPWHPNGWEDPLHTVSLAEGSLAARVYEDRAVGGNSGHHQALKDVAGPLRATGHTDDGLVEVVEHPGKSFVLGVQWHPEKMFAVHPAHLRPFAGLVRAALEGRKAPAYAVAR